MRAANPDSAKKLMDKVNAETGTLKLAELDAKLSLLEGEEEKAWWTAFTAKRAAMPEGGSKRNFDGDRKGGRGGGRGGRGGDRGGRGGGGRGGGGRFKRGRY